MNVYGSTQKLLLEGGGLGVDAFRGALRFNHSLKVASRFCQSSGGGGGCPDFTKY